MKYFFNSKLLQTLVDTLHTSYYKIARDVTSCSRDTIRRGLTDGNIRFSILVDICNAYRVNIKSFFLAYDQLNSGVGNIITPKKDWHPYTFDPSLINGHKGMPEFIWCKDLADILECDDGVTMLPVTVNGTQVTLSHETDTHTVEEKVDENNQTVTNRDGDAYVFNMTLMSSLPSILGINRVDIGRCIGRNDCTFTYIINKQNVRMLTLVAICNHYHVDIMKFFCKLDYLPMDIIVPDDKWSPITFHPERLTMLHEERKQHELLEKLGYSKQRYYRTVNPETTPLSATEFVEILNRLEVEPNFFFDAPEVASNNIVEQQLNKKIKKQQEDIDRLTRTKNLLESRLRHKEAMEKM